MFLSGKPFQSSVMFVSKVGANPSVSTCVPSMVRSWPCSQTLNWAGRDCQRQTSEQFVSYKEGSPKILTPAYHTTCTRQISLQEYRIGLKVVRYLLKKYFTKTQQLTDNFAVTIVSHRRRINLLSWLRRASFKTL